MPVMWNAKPASGKMRENAGILTRKSGPSGRRSTFKSKPYLSRITHVDGTHGGMGGERSPRRHHTVTGRARCHQVGALGAWLLLCLHCPFHRTSVHLHRPAAVSKHPPGWQLCDTGATGEVICMGPAGHPHVTPRPGLPSQLLASVLRDGLSPE